MLRIAVCDDEPVYLNKITGLLRELLRNHGISFYKIDTYLSGKNFIQSDIPFAYDVIFLDINMPEMDGLEVARRIRQRSQDILLVFVTTFIDYAMDGYRMNAIRYLLKDMLEESLPECVEAIVHKLSLQACERQYNFMEGEKKIAVDSIMYVESRMHKLLFYIMEQKPTQYSLYGKLDDMEAEFLNAGFLRIHKSYLINIKYIESISNYKVYLKNNMMLPIPREKFQQVRERYYEIAGKN